MNSLRLHLDQEVACWVQMKNRGEKMRSYLSDWWRGLVKEIRVLGESGRRIGSVEDVH